MARRLRSRGGTIVTGDRVDRIEVDEGRAHVVRTTSGQRFEGRRAVLADVVAPTLYERLLDPADVPDRVRDRLKAFQLDPGTVKVDWALRAPVPWQTPPPEPAGTVHVADSREQMSVALQQVHAGQLPAEPFLLCGQMTVADPGRSPAGTESMWAYTHVPQHQTGDAGDGSVTGEWGYDDKERFADRMQARLEKLAPGFGDRIVARRVLGPRDLEARDANLLGGAINGGTSQLSQQLIFRPIPGLGRAETPVRGLYLSSASAHPGAACTARPGSTPHAPPSPTTGCAAVPCDAPCVSTRGGAAPPG
ncbi:phytoene desaturase family protein [Branchiibius cervicis]|uniref:Phytoene desaturase family protein n=1 Tax=Branchiibius cervicis TaxID=908252 RepID=A0ABW2AWT9_9MICO